VKEKTQIIAINFVEETEITIGTIGGVIKIYKLKNERLVLKWSGNLSISKDENLLGIELCYIA
jgi:hypothetical protein